MFGEIYQLGYVTRDLDRAAADYGERHGVGDWLRTEITYPGGTARVALAFRGALLIEITEPLAESPGLFGDALPATGIALHHLGHRLPDTASVAAVVAHYRALGRDVPLVRDGPTSAYVDTRPDVGHFSEFVRVTPDTPLLTRIPRF
jgi:hypothetical protein